MHLIIFASIIATSLAALRGYAPPSPSSNGATNGFSHGSNGGANGFVTKHSNGAANGFAHASTNGVTNGFGSAPTNGAANGFATKHSNGAANGFAPAPTNGVSNGFASAPTNGALNGFASAPTNGASNGFAPVPTNGAANGHFGGNGRASPSSQYGPPPSHSNGNGRPSNGASQNGKHSNGKPSNGNGNGRFGGQATFEQRFDDSGLGFGIPLPSGAFNGAAPAEVPQDSHVNGFDQELSVDVSIDTGSEGEISCPEDQIVGTDGSCVDAEITKSIYVYTAPERVAVSRAEIPTPKPKLNYNIVFVRAPEGSEADEPIVIPPPQQKTLVYVLSKASGEDGPQVIEIPAGPEHKPEVFYISYDDGENPQLPLGLDLETALASAVSQEGKAVETEEVQTGDDLAVQVDLRVQSENGFEASGDAGFGNGFQQEGDAGFGATNGFSASNGFGDETGIPLPSFERQHEQPAQPEQPAQTHQPSGLYNAPLRRRI